MRDLPEGTVSLLMSDIEGSTRLLHELGGGYGQALAAHRATLRAAFGAHGGIEVDTQGDAFFYAFRRASDALAAAAAGQAALDDGPIRVRMGIHTGEPILTDEGYVGVDVHRVARIMAAGHGGQVLVSDATARLAADADLRDLGEHRLKDMTAPQRLLQLGPGTHPPLRTLDATNLPVAAGPLLGRSAEVADITERLSSGARLVTLTGPGGIGKTRLALQVASEMVGRYRDGVFWVPMAQILDANLVIPEIGKALGQSDIAAHLRDREVLLLLDNAEQIRDIAIPLAELIGASRRCTLLVTSRAPIHLSSEQEVAIGPLPDSAAVELFIERALAIGKRLAPSDAITAICDQLDALPLAIELAAARTKLMDPVALRARLDHRLPLLTGGPRDAPERQRTLRATIEWSHDLLAADARELFMRLSVFVGGFTLEAAEAVCGADLDTLEALVDMSLLKLVDGGRFLMLETLREYATERLAESGDVADIASRHATWAVDLAERVAEERRRPGQGSAAVAELDAERANLRAAAEWAGQTGHRSLQLRLLSAARDLFLRGSNAWLREQLDAALAGDVEDEAVRQHGLATLSFTAYRQGDHEAAVIAGQQSLALAEARGDVQGMAMAHNYLANVDNAVGRSAEGQSHIEQALEASRSAGDHAGVAMALSNLSDLALTSGDYERGARLATEALEVAGPKGDPHVVQISHINAATGFVRMGRFDEAEAAVREAIRMGRQLDDPLTISGGLRILALAAIGRGDPRHAARLMALGKRWTADMNNPLEPTEQALDDTIRAELDRMDPQVRAAEERIGEALSLDAITAGSARSP